MTCDRCRETVDAAEVALGWPIAVGEEYICPSCYGAEAFCHDGHVLSATTEHGECGECAMTAEVAR